MQDQINLKFRVYFTLSGFGDEGECSPIKPIIIKVPNEKVGMKVIKALSKLTKRIDDSPIIDSSILPISDVQVKRGKEWVNTGCFTTRRFREPGGFTTI